MKKIILNSLLTLFTIIVISPFSYAQSSSWNEERIEGGTGDYAPQLEPICKNGYCSQDNFGSSTSLIPIDQAKDARLVAWRSGDNFTLASIDNNNRYKVYLNVKSPNGSPLKIGRYYHTSGPGNITSNDFIYFDRTPNGSLQLFNCDANAIKKTGFILRKADPNLNSIFQNSVVAEYFISCISPTPSENSFSRKSVSGQVIINADPTLIQNSDLHKTKSFLEKDALLTFIKQITIHWFEKYAAEKFSN